MNIQKELQQWAENAVEEFNKLSQKSKKENKGKDKHGIGYYQQSPLNVISKPVETLVCGINPGSGSSAVNMTASEFLEGNKDWKNRFVSEEENAAITKEWAKYFGGVHYFVCGDHFRHNGGFDDDTKTVWTNLTPFATPDTGGLGKEIYQKSIPYTLELISVLRPKRIILLGFDSFNKIIKYGGIKKDEIIAIPVVRDKSENGILEIGSIYGIPTIQLPHPSRNWGFHKLFLPLFVKMWETIVKERRNLDETAKKIKIQLTRLELIGNNLPDTKSETTVI